MDTALTLTEIELRAENARLRASMQLLMQEQTHQQITIFYAEEEGDPVPSATYVQAGLVKLLSEEREARKAAEARLAVTLAELRRLKQRQPLERATC